MNIEFTGNWWDADHPDLIFRGTLKIDEQNHGTLYLRGTEEYLKRLKTMDVLMIMTEAYQVFSTKSICASGVLGL